MTQNDLVAIERLNTDALPPRSAQAFIAQLLGEVRRISCFTREDVTLLLEARYAANSVYPLQLSSEDYDRLVSLADRIEALLPPE
jgi:hypothetical protein